MKTTRSAAVATILLPLSMLAAAGCGGGDKPPTYSAEKDLFEARRRAGELTFPTLNREFLDRTIDAYRKIVADYSEGAGSIEGMEVIVVTAQMELADLEFRAAMLDDAARDFLSAYEIAGNVPAARANALWSAAFIYRESGESRRALELFEKFHDEYLTRGRAAATAGLNRRYLLTPVRIAEICRSLADEPCVKRWLGEAEDVYLELIRESDAAGLGREARYNLVSAYLLAGRWADARKTIREMRELYRAEADIPSLLYLEARVELDGFGDRNRAIAMFDRIVDEYPQSAEAPTALLMKGGVLLADGKTDEGAAAYRRVLEEYPGTGPELAEAEWQLAILEEKRGDWIEASLHYKSLYTNYPTSIQGLEAPLRIAAHYRETGETEALEAVVERAIAHYEKLSSHQYSEAVRIIAEEYHVRTLTENGEWEKACGRLLALPDRYPYYHKFKENYLMAASIYENKLGNPQRAAEILAVCADRYPGTPLADEARKQHDRIKGTR